MGKYDFDYRKWSRNFITLNIPFKNKDFVTISIADVFLSFKKTNLKKYGKEIAIGRDIFYSMLE